MTNTFDFLDKNITGERLENTSYYVIYYSAKFVSGIPGFMTYYREE